MRELRYGVALTPLKARIVDLVKHAGSEGIGADDINRAVFDGHSSRHNIKSHVNQINDLLVATDIRIVGARGGDHRRDHHRRGDWPNPYRLVKA